ncbi:hypothetical protein [Gelidibacter maritimus]|uniref:DUF4321 domain-containing protein n=1 Tax=Gelidibacter maritimus TaxID=2761487 RepID=A0A7W2R4X3_9FLAO|nr:hypothetical protein [Gelidibacter maritimus]MBA6154302.1 hypothetical protein [Gelidibacter maritimus]
MRRRTLNKNKIISGCIGLLVGYIIMILLIDAISKPDQIPVSFKPIESIETYIFSFVFTLGTLGWILGSLLFIGYLVVFYYLGTWVYKLMFKN